MIHSMKQIALLPDCPQIHAILTEDLKAKVLSVRRPASFLIGKSSQVGQDAMQIAAPGGKLARRLRTVGFAHAKTQTLSVGRPSEQKGEIWQGRELVSAAGRDFRELIVVSDQGVAIRQPDSTPTRKTAHPPG